MDLGAYMRVYYTYVLLRDPKKNTRMRVCNDRVYTILSRCTRLCVRSIPGRRRRHFV